MKRFVVFIVTLLAVCASIAPVGFAQSEKSGIYVSEEKVYADLPVAPLSNQLALLAEAAGIELSLSREIAFETDLYSNGAGLYRVVDLLLPEGFGFAFELNQDHKISRLSVFASEDNSVLPRPTNERQRYLARQLGKQDDGTADMMRETLSDRGLDDSPAKLIAIARLAEMDSEHARASLQAGMGDSDPQIRLATAKALYRLQGEAAVMLIGQLYYAEDSAAARKSLAAVIRRSPHPLAREILKDSGLDL